MEDRYNPDGAAKRYRENLAAKGAPLKIGNDHELADYLERKVIEEDLSLIHISHVIIFLRGTAEKRNKTRPA